MAREGFLEKFAIDFLSDHPVTIDPEELVAVLTKRIPDVEREPTVTIHAFRCSTWKSPRWVIDPEPRPVSAGRFRAAVLQSWSWPEAASAVEASRFAVHLTETAAETMDYKQRISLVNRVVRSVLDTEEFRAVHWAPTGQMVSPGNFAAAIEREGPTTLHGALNIRLFRIERLHDGTKLEIPEMIMDTVGLSAIGLDDLQCHFRGLSPDAVGHVLYTTALYLFEHGPVIRGGDHVMGIEGRQWRCEMEDALVEPARVVIDLHPGEQWVAGRESIAEPK